MSEAIKHEAFVVPGSTRRSAVGGVQFVVRCCGRHEKSVHIQQPGKHTQEELLRIRDQHLMDVAQEHANQEAALEFLKQNEQEQPRQQAIGKRPQQQKTSPQINTDLTD